FYYPKDWNKDPTAGVRGARNFAKVEIFLREIGWQSSFDLGKVAGATHTGGWIFIPVLRIVKREVNVMLSELTVETILLIHKLDGIRRSDKRRLFRAGRRLNRWSFFSDW